MYIWTIASKNCLGTGSEPSGWSLPWPPAANLPTAANRTEVNNKTNSRMAKKSPHPAEVFRGSLDPPRYHIMRNIIVIVVTLFQEIGLYVSYTVFGITYFSPGYWAPTAWPGEKHRLWLCHVHEFCQNIFEHLGICGGRRLDPPHRWVIKCMVEERQPVGITTSRAPGTPQLTYFDYALGYQHIQVHCNLKYSTPVCACKHMPAYASLC